MFTLFAVACTATDPTTDASHRPTPLEAVPETERFTVPVSAPGVVVTTEMGIPHIYATNPHDVGVLMGFTLARDRFFQIDLARRLAQGRLSELLGDLALEADLESRGIGMTHATDLLVQTAPPELAQRYEGYAAGVNAYIDLVADGTLPPPSEYELAYSLLGFESPADMMVRFDVRDVAAVGGAVLYRLGFESDDVGRTVDHDALDNAFVGLPHEAEREALARATFATLHPIHPVVSATGWAGAGLRSAPSPILAGPNVEASMGKRLRDKLDRWQRARGRDHEEGWGSNAWAVDGAHTASGGALLAGDGHLELDIPALMYGIGLDDAHLGGGNIHQVGMTIVGLPVLAVGTNGDVAWSTTQLSGDVTDWYAETVGLGADGLPATTRHQGADVPLIRVDETVVVAASSLSGTPARTLVIPRWTTPDGRWLADVEGIPATADTVPEPGTGLASMMGAWVIPADVDGDGAISGVSFDFGGLDPGDLLGMYDAMGTATDIQQVADLNRRAQAYSQNLVAADIHGDILYAGYQMTPCRDQLRDDAGGWLPGGDPQRLLDGNLFGGFTLPTDANGAAIEGDPDPSRCIVPWTDTPHALGSSTGYLLTGNNDPGGLSLDDDLTNDVLYMGGPWDDGFRADSIDRGLADAVARGATIEDMALIQADHTSVTAERFLAGWLSALDRAETLSPDELGANGRVAGLWQANAARFTDARERLRTWLARGATAASGVDTFYDPVDAGEVEDAIATMIWNTWLGDVNVHTLDDELLPGSVFRNGGSAGRLRVLDELWTARGADRPLGDVGVLAETDERVWWDDAATPDVTETSDEILLIALAATLDFLTSPSTGPGEGGFGTDDPTAWIWGLRHQVEFKSMVLGYFDDPVLTGLFEAFAVDTDLLPLQDDLPVGDVRRGLTWFPRPGDNRNVDAGNPGLSGRSFRYASGPVMRMVFELGPDGVTGQNVAPGGQSGVLGSPHYADQAALWLANEALPVAVTVDEVAAAGLARTTFVPSE